MITAPVSRLLAVADVGRSLAFYRDILGFQTRENVVESGPARIEFAAADSALDSTGERRPRGSAILFFETDDVSAMRDGVLARGGKPSELERANWIKMRMFEIRDPDGHTLWFGQSFQEPEAKKDPLMYRDDVTILLIARTDQHTGIGSCEAYVRDADALYAELVTRGANVQGEPVSRPWGLRDFRVLDREGNRITFAQTFE